VRDKDFMLLPFGFSHPLPFDGLRVARGTSAFAELRRKRLRHDKKAAEKIVINHENMKGGKGESRSVIFFSCFPDFASPVADPEQSRRERSLS
jgi:hypothetical protein